MENTTSKVKNEKFLLFILAFVNFTHIIDFMIVMPLGDIFMKTFLIGPHQFSIIVSSYKFSAAITGLIGAFIIDRFDRKRLLFFVYMGFSLGTIACAFASSYTFLLIARAITGGFGGLIAALVLSIIGDVIPYERRGAAMGIIMMAFSAASVFGVPFGLYLTDLFTWQAPFYFLGGTSLIVSFFIFFGLPSLKDHLNMEEVSVSPLNILKNIFGDQNQRTALLLSVFLVGGQFTIIPFISPYMLRNVGFIQEEIKYVYLVGGFFTIFSSPYIGKLADRFGKFPVFNILAILTLIAIIGITNLPPVSIWIALVVTSCFFVFASGRMVPAQAMITAAVTSNTRGSFMSIKSSVQQLGTGCAALLAGSIITESPSGRLENYGYVGIIAVVVGVLAIFLAKQLRAVKE